ncbi:tetratricopeptide repeat protein [Leptothoe kymatousa]|uniref:Tetratricopeptide repeat protein n=1 Tax=Leptothoe kymatousa TAU-MAC 1615 TaxID=2364775 RepID=A0ABS5Y224_9CYAN|nr:tetratricopeptide repeat protein [Leptothoe kymatousa]MBT9311871.1 tetratricopeptide repeat protein [Leptothoe kymatousa TAU-MAC 1615]
MGNAYALLLDDLVGIAHPTDYSLFLLAFMNWYQRTLGLCLSFNLIAATPLLLTQPVLAQVTPNLEGQPALVREGYALFDKGWIDPALDAFSQAVQRYPDSVPAQLGLARSYLKLGQDAKAFEAFRRLRVLAPTNVEALETLGLLGGYRPEWRAVGIDALTTLLEQPGYGDNAEVRSQRALLLFYEGRLLEAVADYDVVLEQPATTATQIGAAQVFAYGGRSAQSVELFEGYISSGQTLKIYEAQAYSFALRQQDRPSEAIDVLRPYLDANGDSAEQAQLKSELATAYAANRQYEAGLRLLDTIQSQPLVVARALRGMSLYTDAPEVQTRAIDAYQQILNSSSLTVGVAREAADALSAYPSSQPVTLATYRQLADQYPDDISLFVEMSVWERQLAQISAQELRQRLLSVTLPQNPTQLQYIARGLTKLAPPDAELIPFYQAVLAATSVEPFLHYRLGQIYLQQNQLALAQEQLQLYAGDDPAVLLFQAEQARRLDDTDTSIAIYQQLVNDPNSSDEVVTGALQGLAGIYQGERRYAEALALYEDVIALNPGNDAKILGQTSLAYQGKFILLETAESVLAQWLSAHSVYEQPPELYSLVGSLPADPDRSGLYESLLVANPDSLAIRQRQIQVLAMTDPGAANEAAAALVAENPDAPEVYLLRGQVAQDTGKLSTASRAYEALLERNPEQLDAIVGLAGVRFQQLRYQEARTLYDQAIEIAPDDIDLRQASVSLTLAQDRPLQALEEINALKSQVPASRLVLERQERQIKEGLLLHRGFQPVWERY